MRHALGGSLGIAGQGVPTDVDARREHQSVVGMLCAIAEGHCPALRIDASRGRKLDGHLIRRKLVITELLRGKIAQPGDDSVAVGAGDERAVRLDQGHVDARIDAFDETGAGRAPKSAAHHDDASTRALRNGG